MLHHLCSVFEVVHVASDTATATLFRGRAELTPRDGQPTLVFLFDRLWSAPPAAAPEQWLEFVNVLSPAFVITNMRWPALVVASGDSRSEDAATPSIDTQDVVVPVWGLAVACRMAKLTLLVLDDLEFLEASVHGRALVPFRSRRFAHTIRRMSASRAHATAAASLGPDLTPWSAVATSLFEDVRQSPSLLRAS